MTSQSVVVVCNKGQKLSEGTAAGLRYGNVAAEVLEGGHVDWRQAVLPTVPADKIPKRDGFDDDLEQLNAGILLYDAFYRWCRDATKETHNWPTNKTRP
jgi:hypothetical protein